MNKLATILVTLVVVGKVLPACYGGPPLNNSSANSVPFAQSGAPPSMNRGSVNVQTYLASCTASANINACATSAANQARASGLVLHFPSGTYPLSAWQPPCPLTITGDGEGKTILQRPPNSAQSIVSSSNCGGLQITNLTIDGNKANNSNIGYTVVLNGDWNFKFENVEIKDSKGPGSALTVQSSEDDLNHTQSIFSALYLHDNDGNGLYVQKHAWNWTLQDSVIRNNGGVGMTVIDYVFPPEAGQFSNCAIVHNDISSNTGMGISLTSGISGGTASNQTNGPFKTVENCKILGNQVNHNGHYGIIMTGGYNIEIGSNTTTYNGNGTGSVVAGINSALCEGCNVHDNTSKYNAFYGIDAGGAINTKILKNTIVGNGNSSIDNGNGINCGACQGVEIADNLLDGNGSTGGGPQIHVTTYDGGVSGFSASARNIAIRRNHLICANDNQLGLIILSDPPGMIVEDNFAERCATFKGYVLHVTEAQVRGNRQDSWPNGVAIAQSGADVVYPDAAENIAIEPGAGNMIIAVWPHFYFTNYQKVYSVVVSGGGSNYSTAPTVTFTEGGCAIEPKGGVFQDNAGHIVGVNLASFGSSCSSAPTVTFSDGSGSGAKAVAYVLTALPIAGRSLNVLWHSGLTVTENPSTLDLLRRASFTVPSDVSYLSRFRAEENHWVETTRETVKQ